MPLKLEAFEEATYARLAFAVPWLSQTNILDYSQVIQVTWILNGCLLNE